MAYSRYVIFHPPLPNDKIIAIDKIAFGVVNKIILIFDEAWWPNRLYFPYIWYTKDKVNLSESDLWLSQIRGASTSLACKNSLTLWTTGYVGKKAETLTDEIVQQKSMELLRRFMGKNYTIPEPNGILRSKWHSNPFVRGSYTYDNLETPKYPKARENLGAPLLDASGTPKVLFAGEATNPLHYATVHGASETGYREAMRLLNA